MPQKSEVISNTNPSREEKSFTIDENLVKKGSQFSKSNLKRDACGLRTNERREVRFAIADAKRGTLTRIAGEALNGQRRRREI